MQIRCSVCMMWPWFLGPRSCISCCSFYSPWGVTGILMPSYNKSSVIEEPACYHRADDSTTRTTCGNTGWLTWRKEEELSFKCQLCFDCSNSPPPLRMSDRSRLVRCSTLGSLPVTAHCEQNLLLFIRLKEEGQPVLPLWAPTKGSPMMSSLHPTAVQHQGLIAIYANYQLLSGQRNTGPQCRSICCGISISKTILVQGDISCWHWCPIPVVYQLPPSSHLFLGRTIFCSSIETH